MVLLIGTKPALLPNDFNSDWTLIIMIFLILFSNLPLYVMFSILLITMVGLFANLMLKMLFLKATCLKMFSWLNHWDSLIVIISIMCANFANLSMVSSKHHVVGILSSFSFFSPMALLTPILTYPYLSLALVVSWSISLFMLMTLS